MGPYPWRLFYKSGWGGEYPPPRHMPDFSTSILSSFCRVPAGLDKYPAGRRKSPAGLREYIVY